MTTSAPGGAFWTKFERQAVAYAMLLLLGACSPPPAQESETRPHIRIIQISMSTNAAIVSGTGTVQLRREIPLGFSSEGRIASLDVNDGDVVHAGQRIAALDNTLVASDLARTEADGVLATAEYDRSRSLFEKGWITRGRVESSRAAMLRSQAANRASHYNRAGAVILAPGPGRILARLAEPGQMVAVGTPVVVLGDEKSGYVLQVALTDRDVGQLSIGAPAKVTITGLDEIPLAGRVSEIAGRADSATGTFRVKIDLTPSPRLRSGMIGEAHIVGRTNTSPALTVTASALVSPRQDTAFVYVVDRTTSRVRLRQITLSGLDDHGARVIKGLMQGEWVAVSGIERLHDGLLIDPVVTKP